MSEEQKLFDEAKALHDKGTNEALIEAIDKFLEVAQSVGKLHENYSLSYYYAGYSYERMKDYDKAFACYDDARKCPKPSKLVLNALGRFYYSGYHVAQDINMAFHYFKRGADAGNNISHYRLGKIHLEKSLEKCDDESAFNHLTIAHNAGVEKAALPLAECYEKGIGTNKDLEAASRALDKYPKNMEYMLKSGEYLTELGNFKEASIRFSKILEKDSENSKEVKKAKDLLAKIKNIHIPKAVYEKLTFCGDDFSEIEAVMDIYGEINAETIYDFAIEEEAKENTSLSIKLFIVAAANGCRKAQYTLCNMSAADTKYFTDIIEHGV